MEMVGGEISFWHKWNSSKKSERVIDACFDAFIQCNPMYCTFTFRLYCAEMQKAVNAYLFFHLLCFSFLIKNLIKNLNANFGRFCEFFWR